jgi:peptide/nickel transport system permease protein
MVAQLVDPASAGGHVGTGDSSADFGAPRHPRLRATLEWGIPAGFLVLLLLACFVWPEVYPIRNPVKGNLLYPMLPALSPHYLFGTDQYGNDILSRILFGGRVSIEVGLGTVTTGLVIGGFLGAVAALKGGIIEIAIMRTLEVFLALPSLVLAIVVATYLGPSELHVIWAISFFSIPAFARLSRANTLRIREQTFMVAARLAGSNDRRILVRHVVPNVLPSLMTFGLLGIGLAIMVEAALSFLGLGVPPPGPSWGNMIAAGQQNLATDPDLLLIPSAFLFATVLSLNLLGDALRSRWSE